MAVADEIQQIISKTLDIPLEKLTAETKLEDLGAESLDVIEIVYELEEKYDLQISFDADSSASIVKIGKNGGASREAAFATIGDIVKAIQDAVGSKAP